MRRFSLLPLRCTQYRLYNSRSSNFFGNEDYSESSNRRPQNQYRRPRNDDYNNFQKKNIFHKSDSIPTPGFFPPTVWNIARDGYEELKNKLFPQRPLCDDEISEGVISTGVANISGKPVDENLRYETIENFMDLRLDKKLMDNIALARVAKMTPIQMHTIPLLMKNPSYSVNEDMVTMAPNVGLFDLMAAAQTGSGKTLAYLIPLLQRLMCTYPHGAMKALVDSDYCIQYPSALVLAPTRELVYQIRQETSKLCYRTNVRPLALFGGEKPFRQVNELHRGCHVVIATPGRLLDFLNQQLLSLSHCRTLIIDEADRMLDMGFEPQLRKLLQSPDYGMPPARDDERQTALFSATFPREVASLARDFLRGPRCISLNITPEGNEEGPNVPVWGQAVRRASSEDNFRQLKASVPKEIKQEVEWVKTGTPLDMLQHLVAKLNAIESDESPEDTLPVNETEEAEPVSVKSSQSHKKTNNRMLVFCNTKRDADRVDHYLIRQGVSSVCVHGGLTQSERNQGIQRFRTGHAQILVATSVAARGLDFPSVKAVINFGLPLVLDDYVHRIGRTGRMGQKGLAVTLVGAKELQTKSNLRTVARGVCRLVHESSLVDYQLPKEFVRAVDWRVGVEDGEGEEGEMGSSYRRDNSPCPPYRLGGKQSFRKRSWN